MPVEIPGYYFDTEKNRYFKVEKSQTAPDSASWSASSVKRRKIASSAAEEAHQRAEQVKHHIKRHELLRRDVVVSGMLAREVEPSRARRGTRMDDGDLGAAAWAGGLVDKGGISFVPSSVTSRFPHMPCFYVGGEECGIDVGLVYATLDETTLVGRYINTDENDRIRFSEGSGRRGIPMNFRSEMIHCPQMSSIKYHKPSHKVLLTSREPDHSCSLFFFSPPMSAATEDSLPNWLLGETNHYQRLSIRHRLHDEWLVHKSTPAPPSSDLLCVIGTNAGILRVRSNETMAWITNDTPPSDTNGGVGSSSSSSNNNPSNRHNYKNNNRHKHRNSDFPQEIFDQDFQIGNHNILLAGGRQPRLWITDLRSPAAQWTSLQHGSSVAHLRSVNPHQVLVAGLENSMSLYDLRFINHSPPSSNPDPATSVAPPHRNRYSRRPNNAKPILSFPEYQNAAHFHIGWDVSPDLNVVASAQDNGTVKLFSLRSGRVLQPQGDWQINEKSNLRGLGIPCGGVGLGSIKTETPIKALQFQTLPHERLPSLFVAEGPSLRKFSFGSTWLDEAE